MRGPDVRNGPARLRASLRSAATPLNVVAAVLALMPALRMTAWVVDGLPVQFGDYWLIFDELFNADGSPSLRDVVSPYNGHLMVVPKVVYWLNVELFAGSNITLGLYVVAIALLQVALLWSMVPRGRKVHPLSTAAVLVATGALIFAPHGAWSFLRSMSGAAWLTANTFAVAAVVVRHRGRRTEAHVLALLAAISYGTGLAAFAGVLVVAFAMERRLPWRDWPAAVLGVAVAAWYKLADVDPSAVAPPGTEAGPADIANGALRLIGSLAPTPRDAAAWVGAVVLALAVAALAWVLRRQRDHRAAGWAGILAYGLGCVFAIAWGRHFFTDFGDSRYASIAVMVWLPVLALATMVEVPQVRPPRWLVALPVLVIAVAVGLGGTGPVQDAQDLRSTQVDLSHALRVGVADRGTPWIGLGVPLPPVTDRLREVGHHPFDGGYRGDCGLFGESVGPDLLDAEPSEGGISSIEVGGDKVPEGSVITAWAGQDRGSVQCVLVLDDERRVVGIGSFGWPRILMDGTLAHNGIRAFAPRDAGELTLHLRLHGEPELVQVPDPLRVAAKAAAGR